MKLIALDLDGTALNNEKKMTEATVNTIRKAQQAGHVVMIMTGRSAESAEEVLREHGLECPVGGSNGAVLKVGDKEIASYFVDPSYVTRIAELLESEQLPYKVATTDGMYGHPEWDERMKRDTTSPLVPKPLLQHPLFPMFAKLLEEYKQSSFKNVQDLPDYRIISFLILAMEPAKKERVEKRLRHIPDIGIIQSAPFTLEVVNPKAGKGQGLERMAKYFGIPMSETVAIGDETNDISMLEAAGLGIAMGNAPEDVQQAADAMTSSNEEDGVAYAIQQYVLGI